MISSSDEQVVIALRVAAHRIVVPPESRWVRERQSVRAKWMMATLAMVALVAIVGALRGEPRTVPGSVSHTVPPSATPAASAPGPVIFDVSDDAPWVTARAKAAPDFVVLRPTWLPRMSESASTCDMDMQSLGDTTSEEYHVIYRDSRQSILTSQNVSGRCVLALGGHRDNRTPEPLATFVVARGSVVVYVRHFFDSFGLGYVHLEWQENGAFYEASAQGYELSELVRVVNSLEPVR